ncbi:MAG: hypothetical protein MIO92_14205 [Methanosarcinaceae archaeon]|nr:hypothetical protein [Methanosarcinaceae archaeon]
MKKKIVIEIEVDVEITKAEVGEADTVLDSQALVEKKDQGQSKAQVPASPAAK